MTGPRVTALVLAAGRSSRMGGPNKLLATFGGVPLVRRSVETALGSCAARVSVVLGHEQARLRAALDGLDVEIVENPAFAEGLSTSLYLGFPPAGRGADGVLVMLADQPTLGADHLDALIGSFRSEGPGSIVVATADGVRGNPVVLASRFTDDVGRIVGDRGARWLINANETSVLEVEIGPAALLDVDTPEAMRAAGGVLPDDAVPGRS